ncbi:protein GDAP2 homolog [Cyclospora cayetanensis]|uniref:Protein GDAP2 homolog n=1 Tax=Cyclospora cayetanensis TaxID=88456 RepID=A0A6P5WDL1_9EIME|nr:protein GDAP2 homolog [Cyclospora cayetanensis]
MSLSDMIQDAAAWVTEEIRKSLEDLNDETSSDILEGRVQNAAAIAQQRFSRVAKPITKILSPDDLTSWEDSKSTCDNLGDDLVAVTPEGSTTTHTPTNQNPFSNIKVPAKPAQSSLPFRVDAQLNRRLFLYDGDICSLGTDCLMCFTTDGFSSSDGLAARLLAIGGEDLYAELSYQDLCKAGEARLCRSFNLPSTHIAYTVTPRFTNRYVTATHNALNSSIREVFIALKESRLRSVAIPCLPPRLASIQRSESKRLNSGAAEADPTAAAALGGEYAVMHTMLRSIRRWMEKMRDDIDAVVLVLGTPGDAAVYRQHLPAYFPRDVADELDAAFLMPREVGGDDGEIVVADRRIPLIRKGGSRGSGEAAKESSEGQEAVASSHPAFGGMLAPRESSDEDGGSDSDREILDSTDVSFRIAKSGTETEKRLHALNIKGHGTNVSLDNCETLYQTYLRQATLLSDSSAGTQLQQLRFIYPSGSDNAGRPIVVFLAAAFPAAKVDSYFLLLHIIKTLDPFIRDKYTLLYVNSAVHHSNAPSMSLWSEFFAIMEKFEDNLDQLLVLHPGVLFKAAFTCCWPYLASHVWSGTVYLKTIKDLSIHASSHTPELPNYVREYEEKPKTKILGMTL